MRILKFGGKSLETTEKMQKICKYIKKIYKNDKKIIIIVSAMSNTTNELETLADKFNAKDLSKRDLDVLLSTGETKACALFSIILNSIGVKSKCFQAWQITINSFGDYQNSLISSIDKNIINKCFEEQTVAVIAGFQGINKNNEITTLGRGGSDTTAAAIAATFNANVEIYSDFNGVFAGDPRLKPFKKLNKISFQQMQLISNAGAKVIAPRAIEIAKNHNINIISKSSSLPNLKGSIISSIETNNISFIINDNLCEITIVFSSNINSIILSKNVLYSLDNYKIYNFILNNQILKIIINEFDKDNIIEIISKNLHLLNS